MVATEWMTGGTLTVFLSSTYRSPWLFLRLWHHLMPSQVQNLRGSEKNKKPRWARHPQWDIPSP